jgi:gas vesicle protein
MMDNGRDYRNNGISPLTAALVGAAVGAVAVALSSRETREKLAAKLNEMSEKAHEGIDEAKMKADDLKRTGKAKVARELEKARDRLTETT